MGGKHYPDNHTNTYTMETTEKLFERVFTKKFSEGDYSSRVKESDSDSHKITNEVISKAFKEIAEESEVTPSLVSLLLESKQSSSIRIGNVIEMHLNEVLKEVAANRPQVVYEKLHEKLGIEGERFYVEEEGGEKQIDLLYGVSVDGVFHVFYWEIKASTNLDSEKAKATRKKIKSVGQEIEKRIGGENVKVHAMGLAPLFDSKKNIPKDAKKAFEPYGSLWETMPDYSETAEELLRSAKRVYKRYMKSELNRIS